MSISFDENGHAVNPGTVRVFNYSNETGEYRGWSDEFIPVGVSIPGSSTLIDPGEDKAGYVWVFDGEQWHSVDDHRGKTTYSTGTRAESTVSYIGAIKDGYTLLEPATPYDKWDGAKWVFDADAAHAADVEAAIQKKNTQRNAADSEIAWLQDAVDAGIATDEETEALKSWKAYRVQLMRVDTSKAPDISWPEVNTNK